MNQRRLSPGQKAGSRKPASTATARPTTSWAVASATASALCSSGSKQTSTFPRARKTTLASTDPFGLQKVNKTIYTSIYIGIFVRFTRLGTIVQVHAGYTKLVYS